MPIPVISTEEARRKLAGLVDPERPVGGEAVATDVRDTAVRFATILASLFGDSLDRLTLWERIASGFDSACAKVDDGDLDRFASLCLTHVLADAGRAAACDALGQTLGVFAARPIEWRQAFVRWCRSHRYPLVVHARARWESIKKGQVEL